MNYLVFLNAQAGELEKILSGMKSMVVKELDTARKVSPMISSGDNLYFLRGNNDSSLRVKATVVQAREFTTEDGKEDLSHILKEMQPRLQLTEDQYNYWVEKKQAVLIEFEHAHKINEIRLPEYKIRSLSGWVPFEEFNMISEWE